MNKFAGIIFSLVIIVIITVVGIGIYKSGLESKNKVDEKQEEIVEKKEDLRLGVLNLDTFNPILTKNRYVYDMTNLFYDSLVDLDGEYRASLELAESIEKKQELEYLITLKDVKWNSLEDKLSAEDVKFTIEKIKTTGGIYSENVKNIAGVKVLNNKSISVILNEPDPFFKYSLTFPIMKKVDDVLFNDASAYGVPHGIGMYFLSKIENNILIFKLNRNYHGFTVKDGKKEEPFVKEILVKRFTSGEELYNEFKSGGIDILETDKTDIEKFLGSYGYIKTAYKGRDFSFMSFNCKQITDTSLRKAIFNILDKPKILNELDKSVVETSYILDNGNWTYKKGIDIEKNLNMAKLILEESGYIRNEGKWKKEDKEVVLNILINDAKNNEKKAGEIIKGQLEAFGFTVNLIIQNSEQYKESILNKNYDIAIMTIRNSFSPSLEKFFGGNNYFNYRNENISELLNEVNSNEEKEMINIYRKIEDIYIEDPPFIPIFRNRRYFLTSNGLNANIIPNSHNIFQDFIKWYRK